MKKIVMMMKIGAAIAIAGTAQAWNSGYGGNNYGSRGGYGGNRHGSYGGRGYGRSQYRPEKKSYDAVEYFGDNGKDYGFGEAKSKTSFGPNSVSNSSSTSYSSSTFGGNHSNNGYGRAVHNAHGADDTRDKA